MIRLAGVAVASALLGAAGALVAVYRLIDRRTP
jgi:hypothetical protein